MKPNIPATIAKTKKIKAHPSIETTFSLTNCFGELVTLLNGSRIIESAYLHLFQKRAMRLRTITQALLINEKAGEDR
ncbi:hypothetical protein AB4Z33_02385 [Paenibacillus sp. 2TAB19]